MGAMVFAGGNLERFPELHYSSDIIICADSGLEHALRFGLTPHYVVGDFDSVSKKSLQKIYGKKTEIIPYPQDKDKTDTQLAVEKAVKEGAKYIEILGGIGSRFDHSLANVQLLNLLKNFNVKGHITDGIQYIYLLTDKLTLDPGSTKQFSILPLTPTINGLKIQGAKYELDNHTIEMGDTRTLSNEFINTRCHISIEKGLGIVITY